MTARSGPVKTRPCRCPTRASKSDALLRRGFTARLIFIWLSECVIISCPRVSIQQLLPPGGLDPQDVWVHFMSSEFFWSENRGMLISFHPSALRLSALFLLLSVDALQTVASLWCALPAPFSPCHSPLSYLFPYMFFHHYPSPSSHAARLLPASVWTCEHPAHSEWCQPGGATHTVSVMCQRGLTQITIWCLQVCVYVCARESGKTKSKYQMYLYFISADFRVEWRHTNRVYYIDFVDPTHTLKNYWGLTSTDTCIFVLDLCLFCSETCVSYSYVLERNAKKCFSNNGTSEFK